MASRRSTSWGESPGIISASRSAGSHAAAGSRWFGGAWPWAPGGSESAGGAGGWSRVGAPGGRSGAGAAGGSIGAGGPGCRTGAGRGGGPAAEASGAPWWVAWAAATCRSQSANSGSCAALCTISWAAAPLGPGGGGGGGAAAEDGAAAACVRARWRGPARWHACSSTAPHPHSRVPSGRGRDAPSAALSASAIVRPWNGRNNRSGGIPTRARSWRRHGLQEAYDTGASVPAWDVHVATSDDAGR